MTRKRGSSFFKTIKDDDNLDDKLLSYFKERADNNQLVPCVVAFSESADRLDLWRLYGQDGRGVALEIECPELSDSDGVHHAHHQDMKIPKGEQKISIFQIHYGESTCRDAYRSLEEKLKILKNMCTRFKKHDNEAQQKLGEEIRKITYAWLRYFSYMFKDDVYEVENEFRIIQLMSANRLEEEENPEGIPRFYTTVPLEKLTIDKIMIGPNQAEPVKAELLKKRGVKRNGKQIKFELSEISYSPQK